MFTLDVKKQHNNNNNFDPWLFWSNINDYSYMYFLKTCTRVRSFIIRYILNILYHMVCMCFTHYITTWPNCAATMAFLVNKLLSWDDYWRMTFSSCEYSLSNTARKMKYLVSINHLEWIDKKWEYAIKSILTFYHKCSTKILIFTWPRKVCVWWDKSAFLQMMYNLRTSCQPF